MDPEGEVEVGIVIDWVNEEYIEDVEEELDAEQEVDTEEMLEDATNQEQWMGWHLWSHRFLPRDLGFLREISIFVTATDGLCD